MSAEKEKISTCSHSCTDCGVLNCLKRNGNYPEFCPTAALTEEEINEVTDLYIKTAQTARSLSPPPKSRAASTENIPELKR